ncbi:hypothetical protein [Methanoculleus sp.]
MTTREVGELPPWMEKMLNELMEEDREVFEALARSNTNEEERNKSQ